MNPIISTNISLVIVTCHRNYLYSSEWYVNEIKFKLVILLKYEIVVNILKSSLTIFKAITFHFLLINFIKLYDKTCHKRISTEVLNYCVYNIIILFIHSLQWWHEKEMLKYRQQSILVLVTVLVQSSEKKNVILINI